MTGGKRGGWLVGALALTLADAAGSAASAVPESVTIPLKVVQIPGVGIKIGIQVSLGGGPAQWYTFDTGSSGFYAAYNAAWWPSLTPVGGGPIYQSYGSNLQLTANAVSTSVGIPIKEGPPLSFTTTVGQVVGASGNADGAAWVANVAAGKAPLYGMFYGDFGSGLKELNGLFAVLPQLPGNLSSGFAVQLGCNGTSPDPQVVVGLTPGITSRVTSWVRMQKEDPSSPPYPNSNQPTYGQALFTGDYSLAGQGASYTFSTQTILDTGGGTTNIHQKSPEIRVPDALLDAAKTSVLSGTQFRVTAPGTTPGNGFDMAFQTGHTPTVDQINVSEAPPKDKAEVNLGLIPFFRYDVVFDVAQGRVGFAPCTVAAAAAPTVPIPALSRWTTGLLAGVLALIGALAVTLRTPRKRQRERT